MTAENKSLYILNIDAKDIFIANNYINQPENKTGYSIRYNNGDINLNKFINTFDYSLDLIKLRDVYEDIYRNKRFSFQVNNKEYTQRVINVTFNYSNKTFNKIRPNVYLKFGYAYSEIVFKDSVCIFDGELIAIQTDIEVCEKISDEILGKEFYFEDGVYKAKSNLPVLHSVAELRTYLYCNSFYCDGIEYVRFKRSSGSSRVGKCLFIDKKLYNKMHKWEMCGLKIVDFQDLDLAAWEAYIALSLSSIIDTIEIDPKSILVIDDYKSVFKDNVIVTRLNNKHLQSAPENVEIQNSIWDGQSLLDSSMFGNYSGYGMLLLRNQFFKSCCFNTNIQQFFKDNHIEEINQLNGFTLAQKVTDIKLITTPSSVKYLKFGSLIDWLNNIDPMFGIVKHEKPTHNFDGRMVQMHYQLLNTLQLNHDDVKELIKPSLDFVSLLRNDPDVLRYQIKYPEDKAFEITPLNSKNDIVYNLLGINNRFCKTKLYIDFRNDLIKAYLKNIRLGHILISGNYSTMFGNPLEMLYGSVLDNNGVSLFKGESSLPVGTIHTINFDYDKTLIGSRSPHVTMGNVWLPKNIKHDAIDKYFNLSNEIVCVNSINENLLERLNSCDFDSDTVLLSDNQILINAAQKHYADFKVPTSMVEAIKTKRKYTNEEKADLDIKTSVNKIGEIINLSQELNSMLWNNLHNGQTIEDNLELYYDICTLSVMSCIEIDKAKKEFLVDNTVEMKLIKNKYTVLDSHNKVVKPYFFSVLSKQKGFYNPNGGKSYKYFHTSMDYLQMCLNAFRFPKDSSSYVSFIDIANANLFNKSLVKYDQIDRIINIVRNLNNNIKLIWNSNGDLSVEDKYKTVANLRQDCIEYVDKIQLSYSTMYRLLSMIEENQNKDISRLLFSILFGTPNKSFFKLIEKSKENLLNLKECQYGNIKLYGFTFIKE